MPLQPAEGLERVLQRGGEIDAGDNSRSDGFVFPGLPMFKRAGRDLDDVGHALPCLPGADEILEALRFTAEVECTTAAGAPRR